MRRLGYLCLALNSCVAPSVRAATRPHYGGTLRVQVISMFASPEALPLVSETLVRFDEHGDPQPALARGWQSDPDKKRWRFIVRPKVAPAAVIAAGLRPALKKFYRDVTVTSNAQSIVIQSGTSMPDILDRLSRPDAGIPGTGPFRVTKWEPGRRAVLTANEDYLGGRPFVDAVEFSIATQRTYQATAADLWELPVGIGRRSIPDWMRVWTSAPLDLIALRLKDPPPGLRDALALSIDRPAIVNVLTQRRGEVASGLLPQSLTGYEFLFQTTFDPARAKEIATPARAATLSLASPPSDALARSIADRVVLNARDANLSVQLAAQPADATIQLVHVRVGCAGAGPAFRAIVGDSAPSNLTTPEALYHSEKAVLDEGRIIPLIHVPQVFGVGPRVRSSMGLPTCDLLGAIPNLWLTP
jgi:peptide/nickel transport system substrate-binding protein